MAGEITEGVKAGIGCLFWVTIIYVIFAVGYFALNIILYLLPIILSVFAVFAVLYGIGYVIFALISGR